MSPHSSQKASEVIKQLRELLCSKPSPPHSEYISKSSLWPVRPYVILPHDTLIFLPSHSLPFSTQPPPATSGSVMTTSGPLFLLASLFFQICACLTLSLHSDFYFLVPDQGHFPPSVTVCASLVLLLNGIYCRPIYRISPWLSVSSQEPRMCFVHC